MVSVVIVALYIADLFGVGKVTPYGRCKYDAHNIMYPQLFIV